LQINLSDKMRKTNHFKGWYIITPLRNCMNYCKLIGMQDVDCRQWIAVDLLDSSGLEIVDSGLWNDVRTSGF